MAAEDWEPFFKLSDDCLLIVPIIAAAAEEGDAPEFELPAETFHELRRDAPKYLPGSVVGIAEFRRSRRPGGASAPMRRSVRKIGRNDVCPCGSGRKYKRCCGA